MRELAAGFRAYMSLRGPICKPLQPAAMICLFRTNDIRQLYAAFAGTESLSQDKVIARSRTTAQLATIRHSYAINDKTM